MCNSNHTFRSFLRRCVIAVALYLGTGLAAASPFGDDIPRELAEALLASRPGEEVTFRSDWPDAIPEPSLPESVSLLGHLQQNQSQVRLALRAGEPLALSRQRMLSALEEVGYDVITPPPSPHPDQRGFVDATGYPDQMPIQLCSASQGLLHVGIAAQALVLANMPRQTPVDCEEMRERFERRGAMRGNRSGLQEQLPRLELPIGASQRRSPIASFGTSSSARQAETRSAVTTELSLRELHRHLADQLPDQGWTADGELTGGSRIASGWTRADGERELLGTLEVVATSDDSGKVFRLGFVVESL